MCVYNIFYFWSAGGIRWLAADIKDVRSIWIGCFGLYFLLIRVIRPPPCFERWISLIVICWLRGVLKI